MRTRRVATFCGALFALLLLSVPAQSMAADLTINTPQTFASLDGSSVDDDGVVNGVLTINGDLTLDTGGQINCNDPSSPTSAGACDMKIRVSGDTTLVDGSGLFAENRVGSGHGGNIDFETSGDLAMLGANGPTPGATISASRTTGSGSGVAGNVSIKVGGDMFTGAGSQVLANSASSGKAGDIAIEATDASIDALVEAAVLSGSTGTGGKQSPDGGAVTIDAVCNLSVGSSGKVSSRGKSSAADLVHLEGGCDVYVGGLIESTGIGKSVPAAPTNSCYYETAGTPGGPAGDDPQGPRPDKPEGSVACIEIWSGGSVFIDRSFGAQGELNVDLATGCSPGKRGWIDVYARGDVAVINDTDQYVAHATNANGAGTTAGLINLVSTDGAVFANGKVAQANSLANKGHGGSINLAASSFVQLFEADLEARGDAGAAGAYGAGGQMAVRSHNDTVSWTDGLGDVTPTGTGAPKPIPAASRGTIDVSHCLGYDATGTAFPSSGTPTTPSVSVACGGAPTPPGYVVLP